MLVLALETAAGEVSAALLDAAADEPLGGRAVPGAGGGDHLIALVRDLLDEAGRRFGEVDVIAANRGPGSFTGVRTGVAAARALALALERPVLGVTTFEVLAAGAQPGAGETVVAALDARRGQLYVQVFDHALQPLMSPRAVAPADALAGLAGPLLVAGSGAQLLVDANDHPDAIRMVGAGLDACAVGRTAVMKMRAGLAPVPGFRLEPLYLRPPDARPKRPILVTRPAAGP